MEENTIRRAWANAKAKVIAKGCDYEDPPVYATGWNDENGEPDYICRCTVCARCKHHTGNSNQGHYWKLCLLQRRFHDTQHKLKSMKLHCKECMPDYHFCCPNEAGCELYNEDGTKRNA